MPSSAPSALTVVVPPTIHCTGNFVEGEVQLNFRHLQEEDFTEVLIALRGEVVSYVSRAAAPRPLLSEHPIPTSLSFRRARRGRQNDWKGLAELQTPVDFITPRSALRLH